MRIRSDNGRSAFRATLAALIIHGNVASPRGQATHEITGFALHVDDPTDMLCSHEGFMTDLAAAEALHLISGEPYGDQIRAITAHLESRRWEEDCPSFGERLRDQLPGIVELLRQDPESRQAVATIWSEGDVVTGMADYLCGTSLQFLIRGRRLHLIVTMRSNDAWYGLPYNLFAFGQLHCCMARCLNVSVGAYTHNVGSMHLYERHVEKAVALPLPPHTLGVPWGLGLIGGSWSDKQLEAWRVLQDEGPESWDGDQAWFCGALHE